MIKIIDDIKFMPDMKKVGKQRRNRSIKITEKMLKFSYLSYIA